MKYFDNKLAYPKGKNIYYECGKCGDVILSHPDDGVGCSCMNVVIHVDAGRVSIKNEVHPANEYLMFCFKRFTRRPPKVIN